MGATSERFGVIAENLLVAIEGTRPIASKDKEAPHLQQLRFRCIGDRLEVSATDGKSLGIVSAPLEDVPNEDLHFCLQMGYVPTLTKALKRVKAEDRLSLVVSVRMTRFRVTVDIGDTQVALPNVAEQLIFPEIEKAVPVPPTGATTTVTTFGVSPSLLARVAGAAARVGVSCIWSSPASPIDPIRFDVVSETYEATYVVMPMRVLDETPDLNEGEEQEDSQLPLGGADA